jgi:pseudaminic acid biosynthesis-associated methylase
VNSDQTILIEITPNAFYTTKVAMWARMLQAANNVNSIRELGCNIGLNLVALKRLQPTLNLSGYEINDEAAKQASDLNVAMITQGSILEEIVDSKVDLTFTSGVLIHINPDFLDNVYRNLVNGSNRYVLVDKYYNPTPTKISYKGHEDRLFKRDFAGELIDNYGMQPVDYGFVYKINICVIKIINNLLHTYDNYTGKFKILLNFFNEVTSQLKD